jgi:hypothetical protein
MGRSGYIEDCDGWALIRWRGAVASAIRGNRGQSFLREMLAALDALPEKRLIRGELVEPNYISISHWGIHEGPPLVCALGSVGEYRGIDMSELDPWDRKTVAETFGIPDALGAEIMDVNDEAQWGGGRWGETPEDRFSRMRKWVVSKLKASA